MTSLLKKLIQSCLLWVIWAVSDPALATTDSTQVQRLNPANFSSQIHAVINVDFQVESHLYATHGAPPPDGFYKFDRTAPLPSCPVGSIQDPTTKTPSIDEVTACFNSGGKNCSATFVAANDMDIVMRVNCTVQQEGWYSMDEIKKYYVQDGEDHRGNILPAFKLELGKVVGISHFAYSDEGEVGCFNSTDEKTETIMRYYGNLCNKNIYQVEYLPKT